MTWVRRVGPSVTLAVTAEAVPVMFRASTYTPVPVGVPGVVAVEAVGAALEWVIVSPATLVRLPMDTLLPFRSKTAVPERVTLFAEVRAVGLPTFRVPALTVVGPVYVLVPERVSTPAPLIVSPPV